VRRDQRTFRPDNKEDRHTCLSQLVIISVDDREIEHAHVVLQDGVHSGKVVDQLAVSVHVRAPDKARRQGSVHALQGHQTPDRERTRRRRHIRRSLRALRRPPASREHRMSTAGKAVAATQLLLCTEQYTSTTSHL